MCATGFASGSFRRTFNVGDHGTGEVSGTPNKLLVSIA
jgi:hypothetical protein